MRRSLFRLDGITVNSDAAAMSLADFSLELSEGEIMGVVGASNSGKSALCAVLAGTEQLSGGLLYYRDVPVRASHMPAELAKKVFLIGPNSTLPPGLSIEDLLALVHPGRRGRIFLNPRWAHSAAEQILSELEIWISTDMSAAGLSTAQQHLILIAEAYLSNAELIALNNTVSGYTDAEWHAISRTLRIVQERGIAVLITSNLENRLDQICDHIAIMAERTILKVFEPSEYGLLTSLLAQRAVSAAPEITPKRCHWVSNIVVFSSVNATAGILQQADFTIHRGEIIGIFDPDNMAGQDLYEAMMKMDAGAGMFLLDGKQLKHMPPDQALRLGIGFMPENAISKQLFPQQSVMNNLLCASKDKLGLGFWFHRRSLKHLAGTMANRLGLRPEQMGEDVAHFDRLAKLRIYLGRWNFVRLKLLVCNRPFETVDLNAREELKLFFRYLTERETAVCIFGYDRETLQEICDKLYIIKNNRITTSECPPSVTRPDNQIDATH